MRLLEDMCETFDDYPQLFVNVEYSLTLMPLKPGIFVRGNLVQQLQSHMII